ncbi:unnamed protein product [Gordionus sp. m RMFG-2023]|uniref:tRNA (cytidine(32)/guanosine(34)-2'-O)-methyltransferase-like n=1 Tax=Gordionus sp. m RMFG-2023 TaxID=3053472 RepID=UPI0030E02CF3
MGKSSKDKRDIYYRLAKEEGWRARSAFKLLQIDEKFKILENVTKAVDLCAAPGSWSQVLAKKLNADTYHTQESNKIVAVDLQDMAPIPNVIQIKGDITSEKTSIEILSHFNGEHADLVLCDGAPDVTGFHDIDEYIQHQLLLSALNITTHLIKPGGKFVAKIFRSTESDLIYLKLREFFDHVTFVKPSSSRNSSSEAFAVCESYNPPSDYIPTFLSPSVSIYEDLDEVTRTNDYLVENFHNRLIIPFASCTDERGLDSDSNYPFELNGNEYVYHPPVQMPINPPYQHALQLKKNGKLSNIKSGYNNQDEIC